MLTYAARRLLLLIPVLLGVTFVTFALTRIIPGNPIDQLVSPLASARAARRQLIHDHGLDQSLLQQYVTYVRDLLHGDLGTSFATSQPVLDDLTSRFAATFELTLYAMLVAVLLGVPLGVAAAVRPTGGSTTSRASSRWPGSRCRCSGPSLTLIYLLFFRLHVLPAPYGRIDPASTRRGSITGLYTVDSLITGNWAAFRSSAEALILPVAVLAFAVMAPIARITRSGMIEALESDYVRSARSLGLPGADGGLRARVPQRAAAADHDDRRRLRLPARRRRAGRARSSPGPASAATSSTPSRRATTRRCRGSSCYATTIYVLLFLIVDLLYHRDRPAHPQRRQASRMSDRRRNRLAARRADARAVDARPVDDGEPGHGLGFAIILRSSSWPCSRRCSRRTGRTRSIRWPCSQPPSRAHLFGTGNFGEDIFSRVLFGARYDLLIGFCAVAIGLLLGCTLGAARGVLRRPARRGRDADRWTCSRPSRASSSRWASRPRSGRACRT